MQHRDIRGLFFITFRFLYHLKILGWRCCPLHSNLLTNRLVALLSFTAPYRGTPFTPEVSYAASLKEIHDLLNEIIFTSSNIKEALKLKSQLDN